MIPFHTRTIAAMITCCAWAVCAHAQVSVTVRTEKPSFLAGEPVIAVVNVRNVGPDPLVHSFGAGSVRLAVPAGQRKPERRLNGCCTGEVSSSMGVSNHPPALKPGEVITFRYLLRGYRLRPGTYALEVDGKADVGWPGNPYGPVEGQVYAVTVPLTIVSASQQQVEAAYKPYLSAAYVRDAEGARARDALFESAPPLLEQEIIKLAEAFRAESYVVGAAARALSEINTPSSRTRLRRLYDEHADSDLRAGLVRSLAETYHPDNLSFLAGILTAPGSKAVERTQRYAALGLGRIGTPAAVRALGAALPAASEAVTPSILEALGNTKQRSAVPFLIAHARGRDGYVRNQVCCALSQLTHRAWCGMSDVPAMQARWRRWWAANGARVGLYGPDECPAPNAVLPEIGGR